MTTNGRLRLVGLVFALVLIMPVMAEMNVATLADGSTKFSNGTYWILWDPINDHIVGDHFFINGTTNLSAGTNIYYDFFAPSGMCHTKVCNTKSGAIGGNVTIEAGNSSNINTVSLLLNTTDLQSNSYFFQFQILSSDMSTEADSFSGTYIVKSDISLFSRDTQTSSKTMSSPLSLIDTCGAILLSLCLFLGVKWVEKRH